MLLAIDAGNSFVKLASHDGAGWCDAQRVALSEFGAFAERLADTAAPDAVIISNVAAERFSAPMESLLAAWGCPARWVTAQPEGYGIVNGYAVPEQLGADRWAALIGARQLTKRHVIVVSVGTAVTIDWLTEQGMFGGGLILPGLAMMRLSLAQNTAGVGSDAGSYSLWPTNTADAVHTGTLFAVTGAIERARAALLGRGWVSELIVTGGGADSISPFITPSPSVVPNLVLDGLLHIGRAERMI